MLFMISYEFRPEARNEAQTRFKSTGGFPGDGVKMQGRWHCVGGNRGYVLAESSDSIAIGKWMQEWTDLIVFDVMPVNNDEDVLKLHKELISQNVPIIWFNEVQADLEEAFMKITKGLVA